MTYYYKSNILELNESISQHRFEVSQLGVSAKVVTQNLQTSTAMAMGTRNRRNRL